MTLQTERLAALVAAAIVEIERVPDAEIYAALPPAIATTARIARRLGVDLVGQLRHTVTSSLRSSLDVSARDPETAERTLQLAIRTVAWLDGQIDEPPPLSLGWILGSSLGPG